MFHVRIRFSGKARSGTFLFGGEALGARERRLFRRVNGRLRRSFEKMSTLYAPLNSGTQLMLEGYSLMYIALGAWFVAQGSASVGEVLRFTCIRVT